MDKAHRVLVWLGTDKTQVALNAAKLIADRGININTAWVRSFGPFGAIMYRLDGEHQAMRDLRLNYRKTLEVKKSNLRPEIVTNGIGMPIHYEDTEKKRPTFLGLRIHPAPEPWAVSEDIPGCSVRFTLPKGGNSNQTLRTVSRFLNILAHIPYVDVAQYDQMLSIDNELHTFRIFDLRKRGMNWLRCQINQSLQMADEDSLINISNDDTDSFYMCNDRDIKGMNVYRAPIDEHFLSQNDGSRQDADTEYIYAAVHCVDRPGFFATIHDFMRCHPSDEGQSPASRTIVRSCCRGLGNEAIYLFAVIKENGDNVTWLEQELRALLKAEDDKGGSGLRNTGVDQALDEDWQGYWTAVVTIRKISPWHLGKDAKGPLKPARIKVENLQDDSGLLRDFLSGITEVCSSNDTNIYYIDARSVNDYDKKKIEFIFLWGIASSDNDLVKVQEFAGGYKGKRKSAT